MHKFGWLDDMRISHKFTIAFIIIIIIPLTISYYIASTTINGLVVDQITSETMSSLDLVGKSLNDLLQGMSSLALYVNNDKSIRELITQETSDLSGASGISESALMLNKLERINKYDNFFKNITFNMISQRSYITIVTESGGRYTNWTYDGHMSRSYTERAEHGITSGDIWVRFEENYVSGDQKQYPNVLTVGKNIIYPANGTVRGTFIISIPETEVETLLAADNQEQLRMVLDNDLAIVSSTNKELLGRRFSDVYDFSFRDSKGSAVLTNEDNSRFIISYNRAGDFRIVDIKSYDVISRQIGAINVRLLQFSAICMLVFIIITVLISRGITKPLLHLTQIMRETNTSFLPTGEKPWRNNEVGILEESFRVMTENIRVLMHHNIETERKKRDAELKALQAQISPHFLFNTLNAVRWAAINKHNKKAADMVFALSNLLRMTIIKGDELITLGEELENLRNYTALFRMRHDVELSLECDVEEPLLCYKIPTLLLQPLVENAIIHGFEGMESGGKINIQGKTEDNLVRLRVVDNGSGLKRETSESSTKERKFSGIGIDNVDERIKLYFGEQYGLKLFSGETGTVAEILLPPAQLHIHTDLISNSGDAHDKHDYS